VGTKNKKRRASQRYHRPAHPFAQICEPSCEDFLFILSYKVVNNKGKYAMTRKKLLITASLVLLPAVAFAQGDNCSFSKKMDSQEVVQTAEVRPAVTSSIALDTPSSEVETAQQTPVTITQTAQTTYGSGTVEPKKIMSVPASPHAAWTSLLQKYVSAPDNVGLTHFDYAGLKASASDTAKLRGYIEALGATNTDALSRDEAIPFYANLYNALTIDLIIQNYPLDSIRKAKTYNGDRVGGFTGPWKKVETTLNGRTVSLDDVEHKILRVKYPSPYVHYMVNCASVGCPNLLDEAWEASSYKSERKKAAFGYINSPRGVVVTPRGLKVSSIFKWFEEAFGGSKESVLKHIREYADADLAAAIDGGATIVDYDYDWSVND
jgi:hypothetical protein